MSPDAVHCRGLCLLCGHIMILELKIRGTAFLKYFYVCIGSTILISEIKCGVVLYHPVSYHILLNGLEYFTVN